MPGTHLALPWRPVSHSDGGNQLKKMDKSNFVVEISVLTTFS